MAVSYPITLNVSEPNNNIGLLKIRQSDEETQTLVVQILEDSLPKSYEGLQVFFCARIGQTLGLGIIEQKLTELEMTNPQNGKLEYTLRAEDWQSLGRQVGYFSFRKMTDDHTYEQQFSTRDFTYEVTPGIFSHGVKEVKKDGSTYVWTIEDLIRLFKEYIDSGKNDWEEFIEQNKEIIESVDPGGTVLKELIDARKPTQQQPFPSLADRLNNTDIYVNGVKNTTRYSVLGSVDALEEALANGISVDLDVPLELDRELVLNEAKLFTTTYPKTIIKRSNAGFKLLPNSEIIDIDLMLDASVTSYERAAIICTKESEGDEDVNIHVIRPKIALERANAIGIQVLSDAYGLWGVHVEAPFIGNVSKAIELKLVKTTSWITGCVFNSLTIKKFGWGVYTNAPEGSNLATNCAANMFTNLRSQTDGSTIQTLYDLGENKYDMCWFFDIHTETWLPFRDKLGIANGPNNSLYNAHHPAVSTTAIFSTSDITSFYRIGGFILPNKARGDGFVELKFYGPLGEIGTAILRRSVSDDVAVRMHCTSEILANSLEVYSKVMNEGNTLAVYLKLKQSVGSWFKLSFYERFDFMPSQTGAIKYPASSITTSQLTKGTVAKYSKNELLGISNPNDFTTITLPTDWSGYISYKKNALNQLIVEGNFFVGSKSLGKVLGNFPDGFRPRVPTGLIATGENADNHNSITGISLMPDGRLVLLNPAFGSTGLTPGANYHINQVVQM